MDVFQNAVGFYSNHHLWVNNSHRWLASSSPQSLHVGEPFSTIGGDEVGPSLAETQGKKSIFVHSIPIIGVAYSLYEVTAKKFTDRCNCW